MIEIGNFSNFTVTIFDHWLLPRANGDDNLKKQHYIRFGIFEHKVRYLKRFTVPLTFCFQLFVVFSSICHFRWRFVEPRSLHLSSITHCPDSIVIQRFSRLRANFHFNHFSSFFFVNLWLNVILCNCPCFVLLFSSISVFCHLFLSQFQSFFFFFSTCYQINPGQNPKPKPKPKPKPENESKLEKLIKSTQKTMKSDRLLVVAATYIQQNASNTRLYSRRLEDHSHYYVHLISHSFRTRSYH